MESDRRTRIRRRWLFALGWLSLGCFCIALDPILITILGRKAETDFKSVGTGRTTTPSSPPPRPGTAR